MGWIGSEQRAAQNHHSDREINDQPGDVDQRRHERRRRSRGIEPEPPQPERQQRSDEVISPSASARMTSVTRGAYAQIDMIAVRLAIR